MAERTLTPGQRARVVAFADQWGPTQAARRFRLPVGTVTGWQHRARALERRRQARAEADRERARETVQTGQFPDPDPDPDPDEATILRRMTTGQCLRCGGQGTVTIPAVTRGSLTIRAARRIACPDCGGVPRVVQVVEHDRDAWVQGMATAGDLGAGWSGPEWARIRSGEPNPDGCTITGDPDR